MLKGFALNRGNKEQSHPMILEIDTSVSAGLTYTLIVGHANGSGSVWVDWGDGVKQYFGSSSFTITGAARIHAQLDHTYAVNGVYQVKVSGTFHSIGWAGTTAYAGLKKLTKILDWGRISGLQTLSLGGQSSLTQVPSTLPKNILSLTYMFYNCTTFNQDISGWDVSRVTNMSSMFRGATAFNQNIGNWNTEAADNMGAMFWGATAFNQNIGSWNTGSVTNMTNMFNGATIFNQNIGSWNTANVTTMNFMFANAKAFNQPIGSWNTANVTSMTNMFQASTAGNSAFNQDIGAWNVSKVTTFANMFQGTATGKTVFNNGGSDSIKNWSINTTAGVNVIMTQMFMHNNAFNQPIGSWNTSRVQSLGAMFSSGVFNQNIGGWNTSNCTSLDAMFNGNTAYNNGGVNSIAWDTSLVTSFGFMFNGATAFNQPIPGFKFNSATSLSSMLNSCGMSKENYSKTLMGWANTISSTGLGKSKSLGAIGRTYDDTIYSGSPYTTGVDARTYLTQSTASGGAGWAITGDSANYSIPAGSTGFLVDYASPKFAYSLRNLYSSYTGNVVRVRRSSDSTESNFTAAQVTDGTLTTWVGAGNDGFVTKWYDQSTNRNHLTQSTAASQPKIVSAGVLITDGGKPAVEFASDGNSWMQATTRITDARSVFMTASSSYTGSDWMFILADTVSGYTYHAGNTSLLDATYADAIVRNGTNKLNNVVSDFTASGPGGTRTALGRVLLSMIHTASTGIINNISKDRNNTGRSWKGKVQELVVYSTDQTANSAGIHSNVNSHYSIY